MKKVIGISILTGVYCIIFAAVVCYTVRDFDVLQSTIDKVAYLFMDVIALISVGVLFAGFSTWFKE